MFRVIVAHGHAFQTSTIHWKTSDVLNSLKSSNLILSVRTNSMSSINSVFKNCIHWRFSTNHHRNTLVRKFLGIYLKFWEHNSGFKIALLVSSLEYNGLTNSFIWYATYPQYEKVKLLNLEISNKIYNVDLKIEILARRKYTHFNSDRSFSQLPINVPNWQDVKLSCKLSKYFSLNWKALGNWQVSCHVASMNWVKMGETSFGSPAMKPYRSVNLCPKANQSFSISAWKWKKFTIWSCFTELYEWNHFGMHPKNNLACFTISSIYLAADLKFKSLKRKIKLWKRKWMFKKVGSKNLQSISLRTIFYSFNFLGSFFSIKKCSFIKQKRVHRSITFIAK